MVLIIDKHTSPPFSDEIALLYAILKKRKRIIFCLAHPRFRAG
jgi:hypothetical protein